MKAIDVRQLKSNPSAALRDARAQPIMVLNHQQPEALLVHLSDSVFAEPSIRIALAVALYKEGSLSLGRAAEFSARPLANLISHVSRLDIPVVRGANTVRDDMETLDRWSRVDSTTR